MLVEHEIYVPDWQLHSARIQHSHRKTRHTGDATHSTDASSSGKATLVALCTLITHLHAAKVNQIHAAARAATLQNDVLRLHVPAS
jgi:hypothetical protein